MTCDAYVFDAYGTLFDVHAAVRKYSDSVGEGHVQLSEIWRAKQLEYTWTRTMMGRYMDFWDLTQQALDFAFAKTPTANRDARQELLDAYWKLDCFDDVPPVLKALKAAGKRTGILSNGSSGMLEAAVKSAGLSDIIDDVISVDRIQTFKAMPAVYQMVLDDYCMDAGAISFQSSNRWDAAAAKAFGFRTIWINRTNQPDEYDDMAPDRILSGLSELVENGLPI
ncbi:MAG: haloacid dehalogenase type II [Hyphomicrobiales bacterium]|nr:MAG: haloacid dehalogenase type II [Hyphomicrobiales bacterium]